MTHTKGPWTSNGCGVSADGRSICIATPNPAANDGSMASNARLIAAAPDLLALAIQYRDDLKYPPSGDSIYRRMEAIDAAIAKATR